MAASENQPTPAGAAEDAVASTDRPAETERKNGAVVTYPGESKDMLPIVGIGGSAGSIPALQTFFQKTGPDTGLAYVVVLHLSPEHESTLPAILQRETTMPVIQVVEKTKAEPNCVYVIPPAKNLSMSDGHLTLANLDRAPGKRVAVDLFFRTLADTHGARARAIVLSGGDSDGAIGIKRIKETGGLTIVQDPNEAQFEGMPRAAIATGLVDWVLPVAEMPERLAAYRQNEERVRLPKEEEGTSDDGELEDETALREVLAFLRVSTGRDFAHYKRATILRRLARRMQVNSVLTLPEYLAFLRTHPQEAGALLQDLLISVTNFFRDKAAFQGLGDGIGRLFEGKKASDQVRVWVAGCATGEEAYSIAILLSEFAAKREAPPKFQIFATDIDENAINAAREGIYPETIVADVSQERLAQFFVREHQAYRVKRSLREMVLFALHDVLKDFPFSRIDLVSCRNLLIYLDRSAQSQVLETFHFALRPEGRLFLGSSESVDEGKALFFPLEKKFRLYARATVPRSSLPSFAESTTSVRAVALHRKLREDPGALPIPPGGKEFTSSTLSLPGNPVISWAQMHLKLIEQIAPPSLVVDQNNEIVHLSKSAGRFLRFTGGEPSMDLLQVVNPMLRVDLRSALFRAAQTQEPVELRNLPVEMDGTSSTVHLSVHPISDVVPGYFLVLFEKEEGSATTQLAPLAPLAAMTQLEDELERVRSQLRDTVEQYEVGAEELKASNEELQSINEELRSATEELETSREELQSINEELTTVNQELKSKVDEVSRANSDLQNLMASTDIATIFLDRELQIKRYTPTAVSLFNLILSDVGRPLSDLKALFEYPGLSSDAEKVLQNLVPIEREVRSAAGRWFLARMLPYRTVEDHIAGVVLTFVDITQPKAVEEALRASQESLTEELKSVEDLHEMTMRLLNTSNLSATLEEVLAAVTRLNETPLGTVHLFEPGTNRLNLAAASGFERDFVERYRSIDPNQDSAFGRAMRTGRRVVIEEYGNDTESSGDSSQALAFGYRAVQITPLTTRKGEMLGLMAVYFRQAHRPTERDMQQTDLYARQAADLIERKLAESALRESEERIRAIVSQTTAGIGQMDQEGRILFANRRLCEILHLREEELLGRNVRELIPAEDWKDAEEAYARLLESGEAFEVEKRFVRQDGSAAWFNISVGATGNLDGKPRFFLVCVTDVTLRQEGQEALKQALKENEQARRENEAAVVAKDRFLAVLSHELRTPLTPVLMTVSTLRRRTDLPPRVQEGLEMIRRNVEIEAHFIDDLLDVTRISRDKFEVVRAPMDINQAIKHAIEISAQDLRLKRQRLAVSLEAKEHAINGDSARIQQIIWNVLKNSSKFSPEGTEIRLSTRNEENQIVIEVCDEGVGMDPKVLPTIFEPFVQGGESVEREFGGLGLGLAIAKATIDAHGGKIKAESDGENRGATFTITLPLGDH